MYLCIVYTRPAHIGLQCPLMQLVAEDGQAAHLYIRSMHTVSAKLYRYSGGVQSQIWILSMAFTNIRFKRIIGTESC